MSKAIVTDIEGTTTSISFVYDVLFPYAREHISNFITEHEKDPFVVDQIEAMEKEVGKSLDTQQAIQLLLEWMADDKKITPLKTIQGMVWEEGYKKGDFTGHIYEDVPPNLQHWHDSKISLYVYSSGSIKAQKLLFSHTNYGDLSHFFKDFFDTTIGNKRESVSYQHISNLVAQEPGQILFLSDVVQELEAAADAGFETILVDRMGDANQVKFKVVNSFDDIQIR